ncbi:hypothetical protein IJF81_07675 [bacterium]|nr:hypothetical protein [bacterium]
MNFDVTRFGLYSTGAKAKAPENTKTKKAEKKEVEQKAIAPKKFDTNSLEALSLQNIAGMKLSKRVDEETAKDLADMFALAGLSSKYMPTKDVYARIGGEVNAVAKQFNEIETETNIRKLFASNEFKQLNEAFNIK